MSFAAIAGDPFIVLHNAFDEIGNEYVREMFAYRTTLVSLKTLTDTSYQSPVQYRGIDILIY